MDWSALAIVLATMLGPVLAVWASEYRQQHRSALDRKKWVFHTLHATRSSRMKIEHVQALTQIESAFLGKDAEAVLVEWGLYLKHLRTPQGQTDEARAAWFARSDELFRVLLQAMAHHLKIPLNKLQLSEQSYYPDGYALVELRQMETQILLLELLRAQRSFPVSIIDPQPTVQGSTAPPKAEPRP